MAVDSLTHHGETEHELRPRMSDVIDLDRRLSRAIERGRGIQLSDEELDILVLTGAIEVISKAAAAALAVVARERQQKREEYRKSSSASPERRATSETPREALERAQAMCRGKVRVPRAALEPTKNKP